MTVFNSENKEISLDDDVTPQEDSSKVSNQNQLFCVRVRRESFIKVSISNVTKKGFAKMKSALTFETVAKCSTTKARVSVLTLPHGPVDTPVFMPVGTQGTMKGMLPDQLEELNCQILLNNTYHLVIYFNVKFTLCLITDFFRRV